MTRIWVYDSAPAMKKIFNLEEDNSNKPTTSDKSEERHPYMATHYDVEVYASKNSLSDKPMLARIRSMLAAALNDQDKLPKYILICTGADIIADLELDNENDEIEESAYEIEISWLADKLHAMIMDRKKALPVKAAKYMYPQVFWLEVPLHKSFDNNDKHREFNMQIEKMVNNYNEMKMLKIRRVWHFDDSRAVERNSQFLTESGIENYWAGVDEALQFWENGKRKPSRAGSGRGFVQQLNREHQRRSRSSTDLSAREQQRHIKYRNDRYHWNRDQRKMPPPPQRN